MYEPYWCLLSIYHELIGLQPNKIHLLLPIKRGCRIIPHKTSSYARTDWLMTIDYKEVRVIEFCRVRPKAKKLVRMDAGGRAESRLATSLDNCGTRGKRSESHREEQESRRRRRLSSFNVARTHWAFGSWEPCCTLERNPQQWGIPSVRYAPTTHTFQ